MGRLMNAEACPHRRLNQIGLPSMAEPTGLIRLAVAGALGRTGRRVVELAVADGRFSVVAALIAQDDSRAGGTIPVGRRGVNVFQQLDVPCDVLVDFSTPAGTRAWTDVCRERRIAAVIGTTGLDDELRGAIRDAARTIPIVYAANFSVGIEMVRRLLSQLTASLGEAYDVEIIETHHKGKVDAPSGTALLLAEELRRRRAARPGSAPISDTLTPVPLPGGERGSSDGLLTTSDSQLVHGRHGAVGPRKQGEIGIHAVRMGDVVGQHEVHFSGSGETVTIRHAAHSRDTFAAGALRAAAWVVGQPAGLYGMSDVLDRP